jgi:hypothetical protein
MSTYQKYKCVEITECKLYMRVDDTKITRGTIQWQCLWHEEYCIQYTEYRIKLKIFVFSNFIKFFLMIFMVDGSFLHKSYRYFKQCEKGVE